MERKDVFVLINGEREYQDEEWPIKLNVLGEMTLLQKQMHKFIDHYAEENDDPNYGVPIECMRDVRKMAAILVRCMENNGTLNRE